MAVIAAAAMALAQLAPHTPARVVAVGGAHADPTLIDDLARRLHDLGFVSGEDVQIIARAPGGDPLAVRVGHSTFALRRSEAAHIQVLPADEAQS